MVMMEVVMMGVNLLPGWYNATPTLEIPGNLVGPQFQVSPGAGGCDAPHNTRAGPMQYLPPNSIFL